MEPVGPCERNTHASALLLIWLEDWKTAPQDCLPGWSGQSQQHLHPSVGCYRKIRRLRRPATAFPLAPHHSFPGPFLEPSCWKALLLAAMLRYCLISSFPWHLPGSLRNIVVCPWWLSFFSQPLQHLPVMWPFSLASS